MGNCSSTTPNVTEAAFGDVEKFEYDEYESWQAQGEADMLQYQYDSPSYRAGSDNGSLLSSAATKRKETIANQQLSKRDVR
jgi:hypothetical protein